jgi:hypothetical protein
VWIGQIGRDVGVRMSFKFWPPITYKTNPVVNVAGEYLIELLTSAQVISVLGFVAGIAMSSETTPYENLTGDPILRTAS